MIAPVNGVIGALFVHPHPLGGFTQEESPGQNGWRDESPSVESGRNSLFQKPAPSDAAASLLLLLLMAYAFSWIMVIPYILAQWGILHGDFRIIFVIEYIRPFQAATSDPPPQRDSGWQRLPRTVFKAAGWQWHQAILLGLFSVFLSGIIVSARSVDEFSRFSARFAVVYLVSFVLIFLEVGRWAMIATAGWRCPACNRRYGPLGEPCSWVGLRLSHRCLGTGFRYSSYRRFLRDYAFVILLGFHR